MTCFLTYEKQTKILVQRIFHEKSRVHKLISFRLFSRRSFSLFFMCFRTSLLEPLSLKFSFRKNENLTKLCKHENLQYVCQILSFYFEKSARILLDAVFIFGNKPLMDACGTGHAMQFLDAHTGQKEGSSNMNPQH